MASMREFYMDGEVLSREEFFARTTPSQRRFADRMSSPHGPSVYLTKEEWVEDGVREAMEANPDLDEGEVRRGQEAYDWSPDYYGPDYPPGHLRQRAEATARRREAEAST